MSNNEAEDSMARAFATIAGIIILGIAVIVGGLIWLVKRLLA